MPRVKGKKGEGADMRKTRVLLTVIAVLALAYPASKTFGQAVYGSIVGSVTDSSGAIVPDAKITITDVNKGVNFETKSNDSGNYEQIHLIVGTYKVRVEKEGFQAYLQDNVQVQVDAATQVNAVLQLGAVTQTVEVTAAVPLLKTERTDVATSFSTQQVVDLPIYNRNFTQFELLTPGTQRLGWQHAASENPQGSIQIMVNGQHFSGTSYELDGTDNQDPILGIIVINPNLDSVTEAKVTTQNYNAEFGKATAGVVSSQTKSGSNEFHGSGFWFNRVNATSARDPFNQATSNVPHSVWNQFGGSAGGPIRKDKTFIFGDYQGTRRSLGGSNNARVPTAAERNGDLSALAAATTNGSIFNPFNSDGSTNPCVSTTSTKADGSPCGTTDLRQQLVASADPASPNYNAACTNAAGCPNMIPTAMLSSQALALLNKWVPMPNIATSTAAGGTPNYLGSGSQIFNSDGFDVRADQYQTDKLHIFGRYSFQRFVRQGAGLFGTEAGGVTFTVDPSVGGFSGQSSVRNQSIATGFDYTLKPTWLTDFRFGFMRYRVFVNPNGLGTTPALDASIPGMNLSDKTYTSGMPAFDLTSGNGFTNMRLGYSLGTNQCNCPLNEQEQQFQFVNNWTNIRGNHTLKFGADIRYAQNLRVPSDSHRAGESTFDSHFTEGPGGNGLALATFLLGDATYFTRYVSNVTTAAERQKRWFFYGQDTWRITPKFTLDYGMRWEIYFPQTVNGAGNGGWVQPATGEVWIAGQNGIGMDGKVNNSFTNFAPRLGVAYQMNPKTVIRAGYGRSFDIGTFGSIFGHTVTQNLPVLANQVLNAPAAYSDVFSLANGPPALDPSTKLQNNCNAITLNTATTVKGNQCLGVNGDPLYPDGVAPHMHPKGMRMLTVDAWNVTVQRSITSSMSAEVAYVANKGTHIFNGDGPNYDTNTPTQVGYATASLLGCPAPCTNARRPYYSLYGWTQGLNYYGNDASNTYESLQTRVDKRFSGGYSISAHYTYAHAYQYNGDGYFIYNASLVRGFSDFQRKHVFVFTHIYDLPFGKGRKYLSNASRALDALVGGWQFNGTWTAMSGVPFTPGYSSSSERDSGPGYPNHTGSFVNGPRSGNPTTPGYWYQGTGGAPLQTAVSACNFATGTLGSAGPTINGWQDPGCGHFGNVGVFSMFGPKFFQADLSMFKSFKITEKFNAELRFESYNALNHVNLAQPDGTVDGSTGGQIFGLAAGAAMRTWQFGLRLQW